MQGIRAALATLLLGLVSAHARAAEPDPAAKLAYERALGLYGAGDVAGALTSMRESLRISNRWELLYNVARLEQELGDCSGALVHYREYLERVPHGQLRDAAEDARSKLAATCAEPEEPASPVVSTSNPVAPEGSAQSASPPSRLAESPWAEPLSPPPSEAPVAQQREKLATPAESHTHLWIGWSSIAAGALAGAGAAYFQAQALQSRSQWNDSMKGELSGGTWADWSLLDEQHRHERWAQTLGIGAGALIGGGVLFLALGSRDKQAASAPLTARFSLSPGHASAGLQTSF